MMKLKNKRDHTLFFIIIPLLVFAQIGFCSGSEEQQSTKMKRSSILGGLRDFTGAQNNGEIETMGRFAVQEHNKNQNAILEFTRVVKAKEQVVAGKMYHLTLEAVDSGKKKLYEAKVWVKPWMNFKQLQEFKHVPDTPSFTSSHPGY